jgi:hypothetical protein
MLDKLIQLNLSSTKRSNLIGGKTMVTKDPMVLFARKMHPWQFDNTKVLSGVAYYYLLDLLEELEHTCRVRGDGLMAKRVRTMQVELGVRFPLDVDDGHGHGTDGPYHEEYNSSCFLCGAILDEYGDVVEEGVTNDF